MCSDGVYCDVSSEVQDNACAHGVRGAVVDAKHARVCGYKAALVALELECLVGVTERLSEVKRGMCRGWSHAEDWEFEIVTCDTLLPLANATNSEAEAKHQPPHSCELDSTVTASITLPGPRLRTKALPPMA